MNIMEKEQLKKEEQLYKEAQKEGFLHTLEIGRDALCFSKKDERKIRKQRLAKNPKLRDIELCGPNGFFELKRSFDNFTPKNKNPVNFLGNKENEQDKEIPDKGRNEFTDTLMNDTTSKLSWEQLQRIEKNKHRAQEIRMQREKRMSELDGFNSVLKNDDSPVLEEIASNITLNSKSFIQDENSEKSQEHVDIMMDDSEALDFIFSST
uniref:Uncharacterized protein n=1 Tax=Wuchereria bancrofti TaxID=6293 RepID=A0AAF5PK28_WUCBA